MTSSYIDGDKQQYSIFDYYETEFEDHTSLNPFVGMEHLYSHGIKLRDQ
jgi:hypothetical protein